MSITVNTNMSALKIQTNLAKAAVKMNTAMEKMSSGFKINSAKDDAAGMAVSITLKKTISASNVASANVAIGQDLLSTAEGTLSVITSNYERVRDLVAQAANGSYTASDRSAIMKEIGARLDEIKALADSTTFNGKSLFGGGASLLIQSGVGKGDQTSLAASIFAVVNIVTLKTAISAAIVAGATAGIANQLSTIDLRLTNVTTRATLIGAAQNKLQAVSDGLTVQQTNLTSALSTIQDADVAKESANYVQSQILENASATLLVQANSAPQIALTLIKGG